VDEHTNSMDLDLRLFSMVAVDGLNEDTKALPFEAANIFTRQDSSFYSRLGFKKAAIFVYAAYGLLKETESAYNAELAEDLTTRLDLYYPQFKNFKFGDFLKFEKLKVLDEGSEITFGLDKITSLSLLENALYGYVQHHPEYNLGKTTLVKTMRI